MTLTVGVNLLWLVPGVVGGTEGYAVNLLEPLVQRDDVHVVAYALPGFVKAYPALAAAAHTVVPPMPAGRHVVRRVLIENAWLPRHLRAQRVELVHHLGGIVPPGCRVPAVVTLHDLQYLSYPDYFSAAKRRYLAATQGSSLRRAKVVMAVSDFTRTQAIEAFQLDADKVTVVPPVIRPQPVVSEERHWAVLRELDVRGEFILYPAATYPHKNHAVLVRAFAEVAKSHNVSLVLTGAVGAGAWGSAHSTRAEISDLVARLGLDAQVRMPGYVTTEQLAVLYDEALLLAFPSRFEGFGIPVVEAMSVGCPVIAADATNLPALVGDAGLLVDPADVDAWAAAISGLLDSSDTRKRLADAGRKRAASLAAVDPVERVVDVYRRAAS
ncbi:MAG TPA: glycosyltransferase family 1 protein [Acidothermaceae bacterium]|nr:glycosyltransferase family 1 protein [Acidothermaceae bacterium]